MSRFKEIVAVVVLFVGAGCGQSEPEATTDPRSVETASSDATVEPVLSQRQLEQWSASCALCHVSGVAGAPISGSVEQWQPRLAEGKAVLLTHTLEGLNSMPPLGYCMSCEREDFVAMIDFMLGESR